MSNLEIKADIRYPKHPVIRLVRADLLETANNARIGFEVMLSVFCVLLGVHLSSTDPVPRVQWAFEIAMFGGWLFCLRWFLKTSQRAYDETEDAETEPAKAQKTQNPDR